MSVTQLVVLVVFLLGTIGFLWLMTQKWKK
jgi:hypothetical protein